MSHRSIRAALAGAFTLVAAAASGQSIAPPAGFVELGHRQAAFGTERDQLGLRGEGEFSAIQFCVQRAPVALREINVRFANGAGQSVPLRQRIAAGRCSRAIDPRGTDRYITEIEMVYDTAPEHGPKAYVTFFGRPADGLLLDTPQSPDRDRIDRPSAGHGSAGVRWRTAPNRTGSGSPANAR